MPRNQVAAFTVEHVQVLDEEGAVDERLVPDLSDDRLVEAYELMRRARRLDERAVALQRRGELGTYAPAVGQEAAQVGSALALADADWVVPSFREQAAALARGGSMQGILEYALGLEEGAAGLPGGRTLPPSIPVGSQALHAAGIGWGARLRDDPDVALTYFGDGATSEGDVYEACNLAGVFDAQTVFVCQNNQYAISTPRRGQTRAETLAQKAIGAGIDGIQVDGNDLLGVYAVTKAAVEGAREGDPALVEALTYRRSMHTTSDDPRVYRTEEEEAEWAARDPIERFETFLRDRGLLDDERVEAIEAEIEADLEAAWTEAKATRDAADPEDTFEFAYANAPEPVRRQREAFAQRQGRVEGDVGGRVEAGAGSGGVSGSAVGAGESAAAGAVDADTDAGGDGDGGSDGAVDADTDGDPDADAETEQYRLIEAVRETLRAEAGRDDDLVVYGQDVGVDGGVFRATQGLRDDHPEQVFDFPVAEAGIVGMGVGLAVAGFRPVAEIQFQSFLYQGFHQLEQHVSRLHSRSRGNFEVPMTIRVPIGGGIRALEHHSVSFEAGFAHVPGLKAVVPSTPADAAGLLAASIRDPDPVIFMEPTRLYRGTPEPIPGGPGEHVVPLGEARTVRSGSDVTVVTWGGTVREAVAAADAVDADVEVIDARTVSPLDTDAIVASVTETGRCVVVHEAPRTAGLGAEVAATVSEEAFFYLEAPVERVAAYDVPMPLFAREGAYLPDSGRVEAAIREVLAV